MGQRLIVPIGVGTPRRLTTKTREVIWGGQIMGAEIRARQAREEAQKAAGEADRAEAEAWSIRMEGYGGPA